MLPRVTNWWDGGPQKFWRLNVIFIFWQNALRACSPPGGGYSGKSPEQSPGLQEVPKERSKQKPKWTSNVLLGGNARGI